MCCNACCVINLLTQVLHSFRFCDGKLKGIQRSTTQAVKSEYFYLEGCWGKHVINEKHGQNGNPNMFWSLWEKPQWLEHGPSCLIRIINICDHLRLSFSRDTMHIYSTKMDYSIQNWNCNNAVWFWKRTAKRETNRKCRNRTGGKPNRLDCEPQTQTSCKPNRTGTDMIYMKPEEGEPVNFLSHGFTGWVLRLRNTCLETAANKGRWQKWDYQKARGPLLRCPVSCMRQEQVIPS